MDVQALRDFVRNHLEMDDEELPDILLNPYLQEAFDRTMAADNRWPRYEKTWQVSWTPGSTAIGMPADINIPSIMSVVSVDHGYRLTAINHENAEDMFAPTNMIDGGSPLYFSLWAGSMYLWPQPDAAATADFVLRAYRQPVWTNGASDIPDLDPRLHMTLAWFVISLAYAQQEDDVLEGVYLARWDRDLRQQMKTLFEPVHHRPLVLHGGAPIGGVAPWIINPPAPGWDG